MGRDHKRGSEWNIAISHISENNGSAGGCVLSCRIKSPLCQKWYRGLYQSVVPIAQRLLLRLLRALNPSSIRPEAEGSGMGSGLSTIILWVMSKASSN